MNAISPFPLPEANQKWHEGKVRPYRETLRRPGPVSTGVFFHRKGEFATMPSLPLHFNEQY